MFGIPVAYVALAVAALNGYDVLDAAVGITGRLVVGSFGIAALLVAVLARR